MQIPSSFAVTGTPRDSTPVLGFAAISGVNLGDNLIASMVRRLARRPVEYCDIRGAFAPLEPAVETAADSAKNRPNSVSRLIPVTVKRQLWRMVARQRHERLATTFPEAWIGGGNLLFDQGCDNLAMTASVAQAFGRVGKPIKLVSVGVGPFSADPTPMLKTIATHTTFATVRDEESRTILGSYGFDATILLDPVWFLSHYVSPKEHLSPTEFGVNVMHPQAMGSSTSLQDSVLSIAQNILAIAQGSHRRPVFIQSAFNRDPLITSLVRQKLVEDGLDSEIIVLPTTPDAPREWSRIAKLDFMLSHRMHPGIAAAALGVPTLLFPWQPKLPGVFGVVFGDLAECMFLQTPWFDPRKVFSSVERLKRQSQTMRQMLTTRTETDLKIYGDL